MSLGGRGALGAGDAKPDSTAGERVVLNGGHLDAVDAHDDLVADAEELDVVRRRPGPDRRGFVPIAEEGELSVLDLPEGERTNARIDREAVLARVVLLLGRAAAQRDVAEGRVAYEARVHADRDIGEVAVEPAQSVAAVAFFEDS